MQWRLVVPLSGLGLIVGVLSLFGLWPQWAEFVIWLLVGAAWVVVLHYRVHDHFFWHGAATAGLGGFLGILTQVVFMPTYLRNNPDIADDFAGASVSQARLVFLGTGIAVALLYGLVTGIALWLTFSREARAAARRAKSEADVATPRSP